jgi:mannose-6-phosphate isomerase-like protein (cupin superfamily)
LEFRVYAVSWNQAERPPEGGTPNGLSQYETETTMKITRRDISVAVVSICATLGIYVMAQGSKLAVMGASAFDWNAIAVKTNATGSVRSFFKAPTATLDELECHVTTLNPGVESHPAHKHANEELVIIREGTVEVLVNGEMKWVGPGSVVFNASEVMHSLRNVGDVPAVYHVISWFSPGMKPKETNSVAK